MFTNELLSKDESVKLVRPDVARDAKLGVKWLEGEAGRNTLKLMGVTDAENRPTDIKQEWSRVSDFLTNIDQINWMIEKDGEIVGTIWVDLEPTDYLKAPSIHIMIGDPVARGQGAGGRAFETVAGWLEKEHGESIIYTRHLVDNIGATRLEENAGFQNDGEPYNDSDGLLWQNMIKEADLK